MEEGISDKIYRCCYFNLIYSVSFLFIQFDTIFFFFSTWIAGESIQSYFIATDSLFFRRHRLSLSAIRARSTPEVAEGEGKMPEKPKHGQKVAGDELKCKFDWMNFVGPVFELGRASLRWKLWCIKTQSEISHRKRDPSTLWSLPEAIVKRQSLGKFSRKTRSWFEQLTSWEVLLQKRGCRGYRHGDGRLMNVQSLINLFLMEIIDNKTIPDAMKQIIISQFPCH